MDRRGGSGLRYAIDDEPRTGALRRRRTRRERIWSAISPALVGVTAAATLFASAEILPSFAATPLPFGASTAAPTDAADRPRTTVPELAALRQQALEDGSAAVESSLESALLAAHHKRSRAQSALVKAEIERLRNLSTFLWPTEGGVSSPFGWRVHPILKIRRLHNGADIGGACNNPIYAAQSGVVVSTGTGYSGGSGNNVRIDHGTIDGHNIQTAYLHMTRFVLKVGERVDKGDLVGYVGSTGLSTACHLHLSLYKDGVGSDPLEYVKK